MAIRVTVLRFEFPEHPEVVWNNFDVQVAGDVGTPPPRFLYPSRHSADGIDRRRVGLKFSPGMVRSASRY